MCFSLRNEMKNLRTKLDSQKEQFTKKSRYLAEDYKRNIQQYERMQAKIK